MKQHGIKIISALELVMKLKLSSNVKFLISLKPKYLSLTSSE